MPQWRLQSPSMFPYTWHEAMHKEEGEYVLGEYRSVAQARGMQERWRLFQFCVRNWVSPLHQTVSKQLRRTKVRYNKQKGTWELILVVTRTAESILKEAGISVDKFL